ncbi:MAG: hypothetical protein WDZ35_02365 [Crocinitomicaceae bacterium]
MTFQIRLHITLLILLLSFDSSGQKPSVFHVLESDTNYFFDHVFIRLPKPGIPDGTYYVYRLAENILDGGDYNWDDTVLYSIQNIMNSSTRGLVQKFWYPSKLRYCMRWKNDRVLLQWEYEKEDSRLFSCNFTFMKDQELIVEMNSANKQIKSIPDNFSYPDSLVNILRDSLPDWEITVTPAALHFFHKDSMFISNNSQNLFLYRKASFFDVFVLNSSQSNHEFSEFYTSYNQKITDSLKRLDEYWESRRHNKTSFTENIRTIKELKQLLLPELVFDKHVSVFVSEINSPKMFGEDDYLTKSTRMYFDPNSREKAIRIIREYLLE